MNLLQTLELTIGYSVEKPLIESINVGLRLGQLVGLIGQNGAGKSTLMRTLAGLQKPLSGDVILGEVDIRELRSEHIAQKLSIVLTEKPGSMNMTVLDLIAMGRHPYSSWLGTLQDTDIQAIEKALTDTKTEHLANKRLYELSDGQLQKAMIARALAQDTGIILLDEPTSHLDLRNKIEVLRLLQEIAVEGKAVLISTHEVHLASEVCHEFWCVDFGKPLETGDPKMLLSSGRIDEIMHLNDV
jgi:iron complex transport system ATP-binding protein